jgi:hypothetical protein
VQAKLVSDPQLWINWLNASAYQKHQLISPSMLSAVGVAMQERIVGSANLPHYIFTTNSILNASEIQVFRLTFQVGNPWGFADVLVAAEGEGGVLGYVEVVDVRILELG